MALGIFDIPNPSDPQSAQEIMGANQLLNLANRIQGGPVAEVSAIRTAMGRPELQGQGQPNIMNQLIRQQQGLDIQRESDMLRDIMNQRINTPSEGLENLLDNLMRAQDVARTTQLGIFGR